MMKFANRRALIEPKRHPNVTDENKYHTLKVKVTGQYQYSSHYGWSVIADHKARNKTLTLKFNPASCKLKWSIKL